AGAHLRLGEKLGHARRDRGGDRACEHERADPGARGGPITSRPALTLIYSRQHIARSFTAPRDVPANHIEDALLAAAPSPRPIRPTPHSLASLIPAAPLDVRDRPRTLPDCSQQVRLVYTHPW